MTHLSINYTFYTLQFPRFDPVKIFKLKVTMARLKQGHTMTLHTYTPQPMSLPCLNYLYLMVSKIQPRQGLKLVPIHQSTTDSNAFGLKRLRPCQSICPRSCKMVIHAYFAQLNYDLHVFDIVQP